MARVCVLSPEDSDVAQAQISRRKIKEAFRVNERLAAMMFAVESNDAGGWLTGGENSADVAQEWLDWGFEAETVEDWWDAGCFDPQRASELQDNGLTPEAISTQREEDGKSWGYAYCNGDVSMQAVLDAVVE